MADDADAVCRYYAAIAPFLDRELRDRKDEEFWRGLAREWRGAAVLELGVGTGRVAAIFAEHAGLVVGVDVSPDMLALARERLASRGNVALEQGDARRARLGRRFDLVIAANDPFCHLLEDEGREAALRTVAVHLAGGPGADDPGGKGRVGGPGLATAGAGGLFVLDALYWPPARQESRRQRLAGGGLVVREDWRRRDERRLAATFEYLPPGEAPVSASFEARCWSMEEVTARFTRAALEVTHLWADYGGEPFHAATSEHLLVFARRAAGA